MKIIIYTDTFLPKIDGIAVSVENFVKILSQRGHEFVICCPRYGKGEPVYMGENVKIIRFRNIPLPSYPDIKLVLPHIYKIRKIMSSFKPDVVHIQSPGPMGIYGMIAARHYRVPVIGTYHTLVSQQGMYISPFRLLKADKLIRFYQARKKKIELDSIIRKKNNRRSELAIQKLCNWFYQKDLLIITPSHLIKQTLEQQNVKTPIEVISNGMDLKVFKGEIKAAPSRPPKLLHVGRISFEKNCDVVLKSFTIIKQQIPGIILDVIGDGPAMPSLRSLAKQLDIDKDVSFKGFIPREKLPDLYPLYDLFITASTMETQGLVVLEALASGLPCVGVDAFALPELIRHGINGYIAAPFDHKEMARYTIGILTDPELYRKFSTASLEIVSEHEINHCATKLENVYRSFIRKTPPFKKSA